MHHPFVWNFRWFWNLPPGLTLFKIWDDPKLPSYASYFSDFQMTLKPPAASNEEDSSLDGYDPGQENTARSSPYHLSDGALSGHTEEHCTWDRQLEYILACCSFVNGLDSLLWFPKMAALYNGGMNSFQLSLFCITLFFRMVYLCW